MEIDDSSSTHILAEEEVSEILQLAVIQETDLNRVTQMLYPPSGGSTTRNLRLLEIDDQLLAAIEAGECLTFRGKMQDAAVLCTRSRTYEIKEAEISNSCLLVPNLRFAGETNVSKGSGRTVDEQSIKGIFHTYYEVRECKPKVSELIALLEASSFKGIEYESSVAPESLYTWERLREVIQASDEELRQALLDYLVVEINGYYRLVSFEAEVKSITHMLEFFDTSSWEIDEVDREAMYDALNELIPKPVFELLFEKYTELGAKKRDDGKPLFRFVEEEACKILARVLLSSSPVTEYSQFMESWDIGTPEKMKAKEEYLSGIALVVRNDKSMRKEVVSFPEETLPKAIAERFDALFKAKDKWTVEEITPYVLSLTTSKMNVNALLTKYARCSTINGIKYYSSKHGK